MVKCSFEESRAEGRKGVVPIGSHGGRTLGTYGGFICLFFLLFSLCLIPDLSQASASCRGGCLNGGNMLMPNNIFGFCRCQCSRGYTGPRCQFASRKRSSPPLDRMSPVADNAADNAAAAAVAGGGWLQWVPEGATDSRQEGGDVGMVGAGSLPLMNRYDIWAQLRKRLDDLEQYNSASNRVHHTDEDDYSLYKS